MSRHAVVRRLLTLRHWWQETRSSFWFVPAAIVLGAVGLATCLVALDATVELHVDKRWPLVFGAGADGSRGLLGAVAGSMITVAGVVFSITIVALSLTSSQYTSRVLRNFMRDRLNQVVLGVFVGIFAYCLVVPPNHPGGMVLAFVGIGYLIFFIHHVSISIQASSIIAAAAEETIVAIDQLFPKELGDNSDENAESTPSKPTAGRTWIAIGAGKTGYIETIDGDALLDWAGKREAVVRMERGIGEFVVVGGPLLSVAGSAGHDEETMAELNSIYVIGRQRTVQQDAGFGIRQIVDIALRALSPGINDTTTAVMCVDYLGAILARLAILEISSPHRMAEGELRVIARGPSFESLLAEAFDQIRQNAEGNVAVLTRQFQSLEDVARQTASARRRQVLRRHADLIADVAARTITSPSDVAGVKDASDRVYDVLNQPR